MESPLENQNKNETEVDLKHEVHNVKAVKKANKPKFSVKRLLITLFLILFTAAVSGGSVWYVMEQKIESKEVAKQTKTIEKGTPVVIYTEEVDSINNGSRYWPIVNIMRKIGNSEPEFLARVGNVGEYPNEYLLSPKKDYLLINLESKILKLDLESKEISDLFIPKKEVLGMVFSPDNKRMFIWDQKYVTETDFEYYAHVFDLNSKKDDIIKQGIERESYFPTIWTDDGIILMSQPAGEIIFSCYFDLSRKELTRTPGELGTFFPSEDGKVVVTHKEGVGNVCDGFSGSSFSTFSLTDPITGEEKGSFGQIDKMSEIIELSPDHKRVIYAASIPWTDQGDCEKEAEKKYYLEEIASNRITEIDDFVDLLKSWGSNNVGASVEYKPQSETPIEESQILVIGGVEIKKGKSIQIAAQYFY